MAYIETALVSSAGKLLIQLDDGQVIDAGYVKGSQGPPGQDGADGAPGIPGAKGDPGENGSKWFTGIGAPEVSQGESGDMYLDVANALLPIYQKVGRDWIFLANLKVPPSGGGGGQSGAAGGGGSVIIHPGPTPPTTDNDGNEIHEGDPGSTSTATTFTSITTASGPKSQPVPSQVVALTVTSKALWDS